MCLFHNRQGHWNPASPETQHQADVAHREQRSCIATTILLLDSYSSKKLTPKKRHQGYPLTGNTGSLLSGCLDNIEFLFPDNFPAENQDVQCGFCCTRRCPVSARSPRLGNRCIVTAHVSTPPQLPSQKRAVPPVRGSRAWAGVYVVYRTNSKQKIRVCSWHTKIALDRRQPTAAIA